MVGKAEYPTMVEGEMSTDYPEPGGGCLLHSWDELLEGLVADRSRQVIKKPS